MNTPLYLCLDQGGHASRALIVDSQGKVHAQAYEAIDTHRDGRVVEHIAAQLLATLQKCAARVLADLGPAADSVVAAGLATQRSSIVCWDAETGAALSPVLSWQDTRAADWLGAYAAQWQRVHEITGLVLSPHYGVSKLAWCRAHLPDVAAAEKAGRLRFGPLAAFLAQGLVVEEADFADPANAARTLLWDRQKHDWSNELLSLFDIPRSCLPHCVPNLYQWGHIAVSAKRIPLQVVTGDQSAAAFAFGMPASDTVYINMGTGAFLQRISPNPMIDPGRLLASVVYQDENATVDVVEGTVNGAGSALLSVAEEFGVHADELHEKSAAWLANASEPPLFLNSAAGLGSPWWCSEREAGFSEDVDVSAAIASVMESIVFMLKKNLDCMDALLGPAETVVVSGGLAGIDPLVQRLADLSNRTVLRADVREATATGLACLLAGSPRAWPAITIDQTFVPVSDPRLGERYVRWQMLMPEIPGA